MKKFIYALAVILILTVAGFVTYKFVNKSKTETISPKQGEIVESVYGLRKVKTNKLFQIKLGVVSTIQEVYVNEGDRVEKNQKLLSLDSGNVFTAPFAGTITYLPIHRGETVGTQLSLLKLENLDNRYIELALEQEGALRIKKGQKVRVAFESMRATNLVGEVTALYPREEEFIANISVENLDQSILPGMSADVSIEVGKTQGTIIPLKAIRNGLVSVQRDNKVEKVKVEVGLSDGLNAEIKNNSLGPNDLILLPKE